MKLEVIVGPCRMSIGKGILREPRLGLDADFAGADDYRVDTVYPPGSGASVIFGRHVTDAEPGSAQGLYLIVSTSRRPRGVAAAAASISARCSIAGDVNAGATTVSVGTPSCRRPDPERRSYRSYASFPRSTAMAGFSRRYRSIARPRRRGRDGRSVRPQISQPVPPRRSSPRRVRKAASDTGTKTGPSGPITMSGSSPASRSRPETLQPETIMHNGAVQTAPFVW